MLWTEETFDQEAGRRRRVDGRLCKRFPRKYPASLHAFLMIKIKARLPVIALGFTLVMQTAVWAADAKENWGEHCARCHGDTGSGNTKTGRKLKVKNLTQPRIQTRLTDDRIRESLAAGIQSDDGEELMPAFREKLTEAEREALVAHIRSLLPKTGAAP